MDGLLEDVLLACEVVLNVGGVDFDICHFVDQDGDVVFADIALLYLGNCHLLGVFL